MNLERMYVISWFGNDDVREKRIDYHNRQIDWAISNGLSVYVFPQGYTEQDYRKDVTYLENTSEKILLPAEARNHLLRHFYESDCDYAIIADNDSVLHEGEQHCDSKNFVELFNSIPLHNLSEVDFFFPLNPGKVPFSKTFREKKDIFDNYLVFTRNLDSKGSFCVLKNLKKYFNNPIFYDETSFMTDERKIITHEDVDFGVNILANGYGCYMLNNIVLKEYATSVSTWAGDKRAEVMTTGKEIIKDKYKLSTNSQGHMEYKSLYKRSPRPNKVMVPKKMNPLFEFEL